jgi:hypothetical protein
MLGISNKLEPVVLDVKLATRDDELAAEQRAVRGWRFDYDKMVTKLLQNQRDSLQTQREMEEQLDEAIDNSADVAHTITVGANIMMAEQFTQTQ